MSGDQASGSGSRVAGLVDVSVDHSAGDPAAIRAALTRQEFCSYLRRVHAGPVTLGDEWMEFVSRGCGAPRDVTLTVTAVSDGDIVGPSTEFSFQLEPNATGNGTE